MKFTFSKIFVCVSNSSALSSADLIPESKTSFRSSA